MKAGTRQRTRIGVVAIDAVDVLAERMLTAQTRYLPVILTGLPL